MTDTKPVESTTKTQKAIDFIAKQGAARSDAIAKHLGIEAKNVAPLLFAATQKGFLVTCQVQMPGKPPMNEYRLSAGAVPTEWRNFKIKRGVMPRLPTDDRTSSLPMEVGRTAQPAVAKNTGSASSSATTSTPAEGRAVMKSPGAPAATSRPLGADVKPARATPGLTPADDLPFFFALDHRGVLNLSIGGHAFELSLSQTRAIGRFLVNTESAWS